MNNTTNASTFIELQSTNLNEKELFLFIICVVIILIGVCGNISVMVVVARVREMRKPVYYCLSSLALSDTLVLLLLPLIPLAHLWGVPQGVFGIHFCRFQGFFDRAAIVASILTVLVISIERYLAIVHPLKARYVLTTKRTVVALLLNWVISTIFSLPYLKIVKSETKLNADNTTTFRCGYDDKHWQTSYELSVLGLFLYLPLFVLILLYTRMIWTIIIESKKQEDVVGNARVRNTKSKQVVFMLAGVVFLFVVCVLPYTIYYTLVLLNIESLEHMDDNTHQNVYWFCRLMMYVNSAGNPVLYNVVSSEYRNALKKAFGCNRRKKDRRGYVCGTENGYMHREMTMSSYSL